MQLDRSRIALRQATQAVEELRAAKDNPELFRDRFVSTMAMVQRVGSLIAEETSGRRRDEFGEWWKQTQSDPLYIFMRDVRNAEFKRGESRQQASHRVGFQDADSLLNFFRVMQEDRSPTQPPVIKRAAPISRFSYSAEWYFVGGGFQGHEVFALLDRYIAWLRDDILPTAERLTR